jgi:hypothetical protein
MKFRTIVLALALSSTLLPFAQAKKKVVVTNNKAAAAARKNAKNQAKNRAKTIRKVTKSKKVVQRKAVKH